MTLAASFDRYRELGRATSLGARVDRITVLIVAALVLHLVYKCYWIFLYAAADGTPLLWWGVHSFSDFLSLMAGTRFAEEGFLANYLTMNNSVGLQDLARGWQYYQVPQLNPNSAAYYTHYGSLDAVLVGLLLKLGIDDLRHLYAVMVALSSAALFLWYRTIARLFGRSIGALSTLFIVTSLVFSTVSESITAESLALILYFVGAASFAAAATAGEDDRPARRGVLLSASFLCCFLMAHTNPIMVFPLTFFVSAVHVFRAPAAAAADREPTIRGRIASVVAYVAPLGIVLSGFGFGFVTHLAKSAWVLGGLDNLITDLAATFRRRTIHFDEAIEVGFRDFSLAEFPSYVDQQLRFFFGLAVWQVVVLIAALLLIGYWRAGGDRRARSEANFVLAVLFGGLLFIVLLPQAFVSQPKDVFKSFMPGLSLLLAHVVARAVTLAGDRRASAIRRVAVAAGAAVGLVAVGGHLVTWYVVNFDRHRAHYLVPSPPYIGGTPEDVVTIGEFLKANTDYGSVVFTHLDTGTTGHPDYPHPAWEYYADRRIEVVNSLESLIASLADVHSRIEAVEKADPRRNIEIYALLDEHFHWADLHQLVRGSGRKIAERDLGRATGHANPEVGPPSKPYRLALYRLEPAALLQAAQRAAAADRLRPENGTAWTRVFSFRNIVDDLMWRPGKVSIGAPRPAAFVGNGVLHLSSMLYTDVLPISWDLPDIDPATGATAEVGLQIQAGATDLDDRDGAFFSLVHGQRELKVALFDDALMLFDQNRFLDYLPVDFERPLVLRIAMRSNRALLFVNGRPGPCYALENEVADRRLNFGDHSRQDGARIAGTVHYFAASEAGAFAPGGAAIDFDALACVTSDDPPPLAATPPDGGATKDRPIVASSQLGDDHGPENLLEGPVTIWHTAQDPSYPQWLTITFDEPRTIRTFGYQVQQDWPRRGPRSFALQAADGAKWRTVLAVGDACLASAGHSQVWALDEPVTSRRFKVSIAGNCGDPDFVALQRLLLQ